jgi:hypothetical protein
MVRVVAPVAGFRQHFLHIDSIVATISRSAAAWADISSLEEAIPRGCGVVLDDYGNLLDSRVELFDASLLEGGFGDFEMESVARLML